MWLTVMVSECAVTVVCARPLHAVDNLKTYRVTYRPRPTRVYCICLPSTAGWLELRVAAVKSTKSIDLWRVKSSQVRFSSSHRQFYFNKPLTAVIIILRSRLEDCDSDPVNAYSWFAAYRHIELQKNAKNDSLIVMLYFVNVKHLMMMMIIIIILNSFNHKLTKRNLNMHKRFEVIHIK